MTAGYAYRLHGDRVMGLADPNRESLEVNNNGIIVNKSGKLSRVEIRRIVADPNDHVHRLQRLSDGGQSTSARVNTCELGNGFIKTAFAHGGSKSWKVGQLDQLMRFLEYTVAHSTCR